MQTILVTGGAGFIGSASAEAFLRRGDRVVVIDEVNDYYDPARKHANLERLERVAEEAGAGFQFYHGDFSDRAFVETVFATEKPSIVCHLGARAGVRPSIDDPYLYIQSNIVGTTVLLEAAGKHKCSNFVYASSSSVYGDSDQDCFRETDVVNKPCSQYAATKACCELLASTYHHLYGINVSGLRFFTVYGPNGRPDMAPYKFVDRIIRGLSIDQYGDGTSERDYTFIDDIVQGVVNACDRPQPCAIYNLGNGKPVLLRDFIRTIERLTGKSANIRVLPPQAGDVSRTCADISLAQSELGYQPQTSIEEGLRKTIEWYNANIAGVGQKLVLHCDNA